MNGESLVILQKINYWMEYVTEISWLLCESNSKIQKRKEKRLLLLTIAIVSIENAKLLFSTKK